jgi:DNA-binding transcriptional ArsR family regulator
MVDSSPALVILNHMVQDQSRSLDRVFHALAHPARRAMLRRLANGERNLTELAAPLRMSFPAASKHVRVLERARLVRRRVVGRTHICRIEGQPLAQANGWLETYREVWESNFERLDALLEELKAEKKEVTTRAPKGKDQ